MVIWMYKLGKDFNVCIVFFYRNFKRRGVTRLRATKSGAITLPMRSNNKNALEDFNSLDFF